MFHPACVARDMDLTAIQMEILSELMVGGKKTKGKASAGLAEVYYERVEVADT